MFHFIPVKLSPFEWNGSEETLLGTPVELRMGSDSFFVANVAVSKANAIKTNKYDVHTISSLLLPPTTMVSSSRGGERGSAVAEPAERKSAPVLSRHGVRRDTFRDPAVDSPQAVVHNSRRVPFADGGSGGSGGLGGFKRNDWRGSKSFEPSEGGSEKYEGALEDDVADVAPRGKAPTADRGSGGGGGEGGGGAGAGGGAGGGAEGGDAARRSALLEQMLSANLHPSAFAQASESPPEPPVEPSASPPSPPTPTPSPPPAVPNTPNAQAATLSTGAIIGIAVGGIALLCATVAGVLAVFLCLVRKRPKAEEAPPSTKYANPYYDHESAAAAAAAAAGAMAAAGAGAGSGNQIQPMIVGGSSGTPLMCQQYPLPLIKQVTEDFSETRRIGSGGYSDVYRALDPMDPTIPWAVKRAKVLTNDFKREIHEMASKHHPNLVRLLGFCLDMDVVNERTEQILIYEYMVNGDLEKWVGPEAPKCLTLSQRFNILIGAAHGLEYLHSFGIVHRDIKLANILLDRHMHAKVADFGLVRMGEGTSVGTTRILGTPGYVDPAYSRTRRATTATDVYSFGVVLLEVMTGQRAMIGSGEQQVSIKDWADHHVLARDANSLKDTRLNIPIPDDLMLRIAKFALTCTSIPTANRPTMSQIYTELKNMKQECFGVEENVAANKVDAEISSAAGEAAIPLDEQIAQIDELASDAFSMGGWRSNPSRSGGTSGT
ncbi:hypothetical protein CLOM_g21907 [Closterium sp. NIES-68]|nr:hypothetical protein CLOM_g21907 [Closterium sp. NIES-68]